MPRFLARTAIVLFCLWHMSAIAAFAIDRSWNFAPFSAFKDLVDPVTRGYVLITSQWQQWNLFSPDPLRRISQYRVEISGGSGWQTIAKIGGPDGDKRRAGMMKALRRIEDRRADDPLNQRFLHVLCRRERIVGGISIRLVRRFAVLPKPQHPLSVEEWRSYAPSWSEDTLFTASCPPLAL